MSKEIQVLFIDDEESIIDGAPVMVLSKEEIIGVIGRRDILNAFYVGIGNESK